MVDPENPVFQCRSTRNADELTGNITMERGLDHFTEGMSAIFRNMAKALKPGKPLAFTYHHNRLEAYHPVMVAILDAGLTCSASFPCPAEMGASIHISGTGSSIVDTVLVCRSTGVIPRRWLAETPEQLATLILDDLENLKIGGLQPTRGDIRCIIYGHLARLAIWRLRTAWNKTLPVPEKLAIVAAELVRGPTLENIENHLTGDAARAPLRRYTQIREEETFYGERDDEVSF
jgi:putative DNA methylase